MLLKSSKVIGVRYCNRWSDIADSLVFFIYFPDRVDVFRCSSKKCRKVFTVISNLAVTTCIQALKYALVIGH